MCECSSPKDVHNPTITWPGHSGTYILDKANISRHDNGTIFTCRMEYNGQISTAIYTLQVAYGPSDNTVEIIGPDVFVTDGSVTLTLTCNASDVNPPDVNYAWYGLGLYCDGGNQGSTCSFRPQPRQHDGKIVTCRASNGAGQAIVMAKTDYVLNMTYPPTSSPVITGFTEGQVLKAGDNLTCTVADGKPLVSDVFFHCTTPTLDDQSDVADQSSVSSTVTIDSVNATGSETYCICTADWEPGKYNITYELNNSAIVYIEYAATILNFTINNSTDVVEMIQSDHTTATLECTALGQPTPELRMTRHGEEIQSTALKSSSGYVENVLVISAVTCEDMGTYMCLADNGHQDTRSVRLIVNCAPTLTDHDGDSNLPEMAVDGLFLSMVAHPVPYSFSWEQTRQSDNNGTRNIATLFLVTCVNSGHLEYLVTCEIHAVNLSETEAGLYSVSLSNGYGEYTYNFKISGDQGLTQEDESSPEGGIDDIIISLSVVGGLAFFVLLFIGIRTALSCFSKGYMTGNKAKDSRRSSAKSNRHDCTRAQFPCPGNQCVIGIFPKVGTRSLARPAENCPQFVEEGSTLDCECQAPSDANQPILSWPGHSDTARLVKTNIRRSHNGTQFTCLMQVGGHNSTLVYTLQVAYGPSGDTMKISGPSPFPTDGSQTMSLYCLAEEVNPAPTYSWFGKCQGTTGSTCTFRPRPPDDDGVEATCRALNSVPLHPISATVTSRVNLTYPPTSKPVITSFTQGEVIQRGDSLTCTVTGGKPLVSEVIFHCTNPTLADQPDVIDHSSVSSTVTVNSPKANDGHTVCICSAVWEPGKYNITYNMGTFVNVQIGWKSTEASGAAIAGGVVGGVVFLAAGIVIVVMGLKRRGFLHKRTLYNGDQGQRSSSDTGPQSDAYYENTPNTVSYIYDHGQKNAYVNVTPSAVNYDHLQPRRSDDVSAYTNLRIASHDTINSLRTSEALGKYDVPVTKASTPQWFEGQVSASGEHAYANT